MARPIYPCLTSGGFTERDEAAIKAVNKILLKDPAIARERKRQSLARNGSRNGRAKLDEVDACFIRSMHRIWGLSIAEIARRRKLPSTTVRDIIRRRTWTHV